MEETVLTPPIHSRTFGTGDPTLLFVHGFCCDGTDWDILIERLSSRFRCATLDLPGHGATPFDAGSMQRVAEAVNVVKHALGSDNIVLIGHSLGCKIVREAHRQDPSGVAGMILIDGSLYLSDRETMLGNAYTALAHGMEAFTRGLFGRMFDDKTPEDRKDFLIGRALAVDPGFARDLFLDSVGWDSDYARSTLQDLGIPAMVIQATSFDSQFRWRPLADNESTGLIDTMRAVVSDFEAVIIKDAGHFVMTDNPNATSAAIAKFAERVMEKQVAA